MEKLIKLRCSLIGRFITPSLDKRMNNFGNLSKFMIDSNQPLFLQTLFLSKLIRFLFPFLFYVLKTFRIFINI